MLVNPSSLRCVTFGYFSRDEVLYWDFTPIGNPLINALEVPSDIDLSAFARYLGTRGLPFRITEEGLNQVVWVPQEELVPLVQSAFAEFQAGNLDPEPEIQSPAPSKGLAQRIFEVFWRYPVTMALIVISLGFFPVGMNLRDADADGLFARMMFLALVDVQGEQYFATLGYTLEQGEFWRLLSPMFVHFSWLHIVFNLLWVWEIGRRIEMVHSSKALLGVVILSSLAANFVQYWMSGPGFFGGMSGVVFGLLGHALIWSKLVPDKTMGVQNGVYIFMLVYLAIGFTGAIDLLGLGDLANGAHLGGLMGGLVTGGLAVLLHRRSVPPQPPQVPPHSS